MHRRTPTLAGAAGALIVVVTTIAGCAPGAAAPPVPSMTAGAPTPAATAEPTFEPSAEPTADPSAEPTAAPTASAADGQAFVTQIGNATFEVPSGWTVRDESRVGLDHDGQDQWMNSIVLLDGRGRELLRYIDGAIDAQGQITAGWGMVEQRPIAAAIPDESGLPTAAASWWVQGDAGVQVFASVTLVPDGEAPWGIVPAGDARSAQFVADLSLLDACQQVVYVSDAEACLESDDVAELMAVLATLEQHAVPRDAMP
ncbi:hypothetical protein ABIB37_001224 [Agrococcus sp. UYP10]|uniref:hypothetical protein n=1 Tax=Agrococcus sp. UYP10 TaxID=1756355 RepID=UPI003394820F